MVSSQVHMLVVLTLLSMAKFGREQSEQRSYFLKRFLFFLSLFCTCGLCIFFVKHRVYCHDMGNSSTSTRPQRTLCDAQFQLSAFSWFSFFEYWIAAANMGFHGTIILDFPNEDIIVGCWKTPQLKKAKWRLRNTWALRMPDVTAFANLV